MSELPRVDANALGRSSFVGAMFVDTQVHVQTYSSSQVTSAMGIPFPDFRSVIFEIEFHIFCFSKTGIRIARIAQKECTQSLG